MSELNSAPSFVGGFDGFRRVINILLVGAANEQKIPIGVLPPAADHPILFFLGFPTDLPKAVSKILKKRRFPFGSPRHDAQKLVEHGSRLYRDSTVPIRDQIRASVADVI